MFKPFVERDMRAILLAAFDREDLFALLTDLPRRRPELCDLIERAVSAYPRKTKGNRHRKADAGACRREVIGILHSLDGMGCAPQRRTGMFAAWWED